MSDLIEQISVQNRIEEISDKYYDIILLATIVIVGTIRITSATLLSSLN